MQWIEQEDRIETVLKSLGQDELFIDPFFNPSEVVLDKKAINSYRDESKIVWKRPKVELCEFASLGIESADYRDVLQGRLDNCALVSAINSLALNNRLLNQIFDSDIELNGADYKGCIRVKLWINQSWTSIYIDDLIPTIDGHVIFSRSRKKTHFWVSLLEKAFAKLYGSYENLIGIDCSRVCQTLTSGIVLTLNPTVLYHRELILTHLERSREEGNLFCLIGAEMSNNDSSTRTGHSFSVCGIVKNTLLKVRNSLSSIQIDSTIFNREDDEPENDVFLVRLEDFFSYFEVFTILVAFQKETSLSISGEINQDNCIEKDESRLMEKYLKSPQLIVEIHQSNQNNKHKLSEIIVNIEIENQLKSVENFIGIFILPLRENRERSKHFIDFNLQRPTLLKASLFTKSIRIKQGKHLIGLLFTRDDDNNNESSHITRKYNLRISSADSIRKLEYEINDELNYSVRSDEGIRLVKLVVSKCSICDLVLSERGMINSGAKIYCISCYNSSFRCQTCGNELGEDYYTIENQLTCESCLHELSNKQHRYFSE